MAGGYGAGHISGGCFNPAVAFGIDVSSAGIGFGWCFVYTAFELVGAILAYILTTVVRSPGQGSNGKNFLVAEFIGTYFLVLTVGFNVIGGSKAPVFSIAAALMCMIYALGDISGGHFNPAVSIAIFLTFSESRPSVGKFKKETLPSYIGAQLAGGICAGLTYVFIEAGKSFPLAPGKGYGWFQAAIAEIVFTFLLCFVFICVATTNVLDRTDTRTSNLKQSYGFVIGACVTAGGYAIGSVSGGSLNPAVSFGIAAGHVVNGGGIVNATIYTIFELFGAVLAGTVAMNTALIKKDNKEKDLANNQQVA